MSRPVDEPGRYSLYVDVGDQVAQLHPSEFADLDLRERCVGIRYTLHERGTSGFEFEPLPDCKTDALSIDAVRKTRP